MYALVKELQRSRRFQGTFWKRCLGSPRRAAHAEGPREGPAASGCIASDTVTLKQLKLAGPESGCCEGSFKSPPSFTSSRRMKRQMELASPSGESMCQGQGACTRCSDSWAGNNWVCTQFSCCVAQRFFAHPHFSSQSKTLKRVALLLQTHGQSPAKQECLKRPLRLDSKASGDQL